MTDCKECDGGCKNTSGTGAYYYHFIFKINISEQEAKKDKKPSCCEICNKKTEQLKFENEPFCADILQIYCPFWFCDDCYDNSYYDR